jgi:hypothetical protein
MKNFRKLAEQAGRKVYSVRKYKNRHGEGYTIEYAAILNAYTVSTQQKRSFHKMELQDILNEWNGEQ